jgi:hypothetical protein
MLQSGEQSVNWFCVGNITFGTVESNLEELPADEGAIRRVLFTLPRVVHTTIAEQRKWY